MALPTNGNTNGVENGHENGVPDWLNKVSLEKAVKERIGDFESIVSIKSKNCNASTENYATQILRINIEVKPIEGDVKTIPFVLKSQHDNESMANVLKAIKLFPKEEEMYHNILPKFVQLYKEAGKSVSFGPNAYKFDKQIDMDYILLDDLRDRNFKNANRIAGLDLEHMKQVLIKLAEYHAASACYVEHYGMYGKDFTESIYTKSNIKLLKELNDSSAFLAQLKKWKNCEEIYEKLADSDEYLVDRLLENQTVNNSEFNVLNHGDCWTNNIMFQYDAFGNITNTLFIDFQVGKYGSPANDLYFLILSSAAANIKISQFDYLIRFYYENLVKNLKLLQYHRPLPKLKNIFATLFKNGLVAYIVATKVLPVAMLEKTDNIVFEPNKQNDSKLKLAMYTNHKYVQAMAELLPWLNNRGLLDLN